MAYIYQEMGSSFRKIFARCPDADFAFELLHDRLTLSSVNVFLHLDLASVGTYQDAGGNKIN